MSQSDKRRTGRTTRMLARAMDLAEAGRAVYVVAANKQHAAILEDAAKALARGPSELRGVKFETWESLPSLDVRTLTLQRAHPNCVVLIDHYAIEYRYAAMLAELTRYDEPPTT